MVNEPWELPPQISKIGMNSNNQNEIILYQPDNSLKLEVRLEDETVWLTQAQIAELFGTKRPAITKHLSNIYASGELEEIGTCSILEHMGTGLGETQRAIRTRVHCADEHVSRPFFVH